MYMYNFLTIIITAMILTGSANCVEIGSHAQAMSIAHYVNWTELKFEANDIVYCQILFSPDLPKSSFVNHGMLATSSNTIIHMMGDRTTQLGYLEEVEWSDYHAQNPVHTPCAVIDRATVKTAVRRARRDMIASRGENILHYDYFQCNCEHWARNWAHGTTYSFQTEQAFWLDFDGNTDRDCPIGKMDLGRSLSVFLKDGDHMHTFIRVEPKECFSWSNESYWNHKAITAVPIAKCMKIFSGENCTGEQICLCKGLKNLDRIGWKNKISSMSIC